MRKVNWRAYRTPVSPLFLFMTDNRHQVLWRNEMNESNCMECGAQLEVASDLIVGEILECPQCGVELEVVQLSPLSIELAPEIEEDWGE
jgi:alpha-aminoadipate/glutamate carrier protein LysW